jgi:hypothetical protein
VANFTSCGVALSTQMETGRPLRSATAIILVPLPRPGPRRLTGERGALAAHYSRNIPSAEIAK